VLTDTPKQRLKIVLGCVLALLFPLSYAATRGHGDAAELLLTRGANANARTADGTTPVGLAMKPGHSTAAEVILPRFSRHIDVY
jgi:ankyrin repeat protein